MQTKTFIMLPNRLTPDETLKFKNKTCKNEKVLKERINVLVCANMTGSEKCKFLVREKSQLNLDVLKK